MMLGEKLGLGKAMLVLRCIDSNRIVTKTWQCKSYSGKK